MSDRAEEAAGKAAEGCLKTSNSQEGYHSSWSFSYSTPGDGLALASMCVSGFLCGACEAEHDIRGWIRPYRFGTNQRRALASCLAWHPGLYRQMARATAGVSIRFVTDASRAMLAIRVDETLQAMSALPDELARAYNAGSVGPDLPCVVVDGRPVKGATLVGDALRFTLVDPSKDPGNGICALPGLGERHEVCIWLPCLRGCRVRELWVDGTFVEATAARDRLLVIGDDDAQGLGCGGPSNAWPAQLAELMGLELMNQSLVGQVFQPSSILDAQVENVRHVVIDLGTNYGFERCDIAAVGADMRGFFSEVARHWPEARVWALVPSSHGVGPDNVREGSCIAEVPRMLQRIAQARGAEVLEKSLMLDDDSFMECGPYELLGPVGNDVFALRLWTLMQTAGKTDENMRNRALEVLDSAPSYVLPMAQAILRRRAKVLFASEQCVLVTWHETSDSAGRGDQLLYAPNRSLALAVCDLLGTAHACDVFGEHASELARDLGLARTEPYHVCVYELSHPMSVDSQKLSCIRRIDESCAREVALRGRRRAAKTTSANEQLVREALAQGRLLGAFLGESLVGFVEEKVDGSMGLPEIFAGHKGKGWDEALEAALANELLARGDVPWTVLGPQHKAMVRLQRKLGLTVLPAALACHASGAIDEE